MSEVYPSGVCVKTENGTFYIQNGRRYRILSDRILNSWRFKVVAEAPESAVAHYKIAARLGFRDGTLIYNLADGRIYLVSENKRRHVTSPDALKRIGLTIDDAMVVSDEEIHLQEQGEDFN